MGAWPSLSKARGGVFVRVCRAGRCVECVIEVSQLRIVPPTSPRPPFWGRSARRGGAAVAGKRCASVGISVNASVSVRVGFFFPSIDDDDDDAIVPSCVLEAPLDGAAMVPDGRTRSVCFRSLFSQMPSLFAVAIRNRDRRRDTGRR